MGWNMFQVADFIFCRQTTLCWWGGHRDELSFGITFFLSMEEIASCDRKKRVEKLEARKKIIGVTWIFFYVQSILSNYDKVGY